MIRASTEPSSDKGSKLVAAERAGRGGWDATAVAAATTATPTLGKKHSEMKLGGYGKLSTKDASSIPSRVVVWVNEDDGDGNNKQTNKQQLQ